MKLFMNGHQDEVSIYDYSTIPPMTPAERVQRWSTGVEKQSQEFSTEVGGGDRKLGEKLKKLGDAAGEVRKHIEERTEHR